MYDKVTPGIISRTSYVLTRIRQQTFSRPKSGALYRRDTLMVNRLAHSFLNLHIPIVPSSKKQDRFRPAWMIPDILISIARFPVPRFHP